MSQTFLKNMSQTFLSQLVTNLLHYCTDFVSSKFRHCAFDQYLSRIPTWKTVRWFATSLHRLGMTVISSTFHLVCTALGRRDTSTACWLDLNSTIITLVAPRTSLLLLEARGLSSIYKLYTHTLTNTFFLPFFLKLNAFIAIQISERLFLWSVRHF